ncbi:MAG: hypothetical protein ACRDXX_03875 [Stackebrandtia sp.]
MTADSPDELDAVAAEAAADPNAPVIEERMHGRTWSFGKPDIRPAALRRYTALAERAAVADEIDGADAIELAASAETILRSGLATAREREAFDEAPFTGSEISDLSRRYFEALGASAGESSASPAPSPATVARSRRTSKRRTESD